MDVDPDLIRTALNTLGNNTPGLRNPWRDLWIMSERQDDKWVAWWWRSINRIDIPTYHALRLKVIELRLKQ